MEPKPKERIVFDEDSYYGDEGEEMAINDLMERHVHRHRRLQGLRCRHRLLSIPFRSGQRFR